MLGSANARAIGEAKVAEPAYRVSIGLPVFNGEQYLEQCIQSLLAQTYTQFELVICDNASTDATEENMSLICRAG